VTVREKDWEKAIQIVDEEYKNKVVRGSAQWWSLVFGVYKKMQGRKMLRRLKAAGILRKQQIDLLTILAPILTPSFPISIDQLLVDLPTPFTITSLENLAAHYQRLIPQMALLSPSQNPPLVFVPLLAEEILKLEEGQGIPLATTDEPPEWVETFIKAWYTAILCGILDGVFVPQGEAGLKWILQLTANPVLKTFLGTQLRRNLESLNAACRQWQNITLADALGLQHRFGVFKQNNVTMGAFLNPSAIGRVWCVRLHALHNPLFPKEFSPTNAHQWWLNIIQTLLPCQYLDEGNVEGWVPLIGGVINRDDIGALVIFKDFVPTHPSLRIIEVDFDTDYNLIAEVASKVIKQGSRMK
jgi:hypothetical protein